MTTLIINYGAGNLLSVKRAVEYCNAPVIVSSDPNIFNKQQVGHIILPGVGAFATGMANLKKQGWIASLQEAVLHQKIPLLGICLGMQLLASWGHEGHEDLTPGLGFIEGEVVSLKPSSHQERVPHMGWSEVHQQQESPLLHGIPNTSQFYFAHSYYVKPIDEQFIIATTDYTQRFTAILANNHIMGIQFHPEKSSQFGLKLIKNFLTCNLKGKEK